MAVFDTAELLEIILLQLPVEAVFIVKRVAKSWRDIIETSIHLRRRYFLSPLGPSITRYGQTASMSAQLDEIQNYVPLLHKTEFDIMPLFTPMWEGQSLNGKSLKYDNKENIVGTEATYHSFLWSRADRLQEAIPMPTHGMLLTQPPVSAVSLHICGCEEDLEHSKCYILAFVYEKSGVKVGTVIETFRKIVASTEDNVVRGWQEGETRLMTGFVMA